MKKNKISNKTIALVAAAMLLLAGGTYTGTRAVLNIFSPEHFLEFDTSDQAVSLLENGTPVGNKSLMSTLEGKIVPGKTYTEAISAKNGSEVGQYVRIVIRKYWRNAKGDKAKDIDQEVLNKIQLTFVNSDYWLKNDVETTTEREVYYYKNMVPSGESTKALTDTLTVDSSVALQYTMDPDYPPGEYPAGTVIKYVYDYDGYQVCIEAEAQSIQTHNTEDEHNAIRGIWGVTNVTASGGTLTVNN